jgi:hypothetical protein
MDLGKTVELLACILAHQKSTSDDGSVVAPMWQNTGNQKINLKRLKRDRVECVCGAVSDSYKVSGEDSDFTIDAGNSLDLSENCSVGNIKGNNNHDMSSTSFSTQYLRTACENFK